MDLRADQARARAAAAERREQAGFTAAVRPLAVRVFDVVQPIHDVLDAFARPRPGLAETRDDVILRSGAVEELREVTKELEGLPVPESRRQEAAVLSRSLGGVTAAVTQLGRAARSPADRSGYIKAFGPAVDGLAGAEYAWAGAVSRIDLDASIPVPASRRTAARGRTTPTRGGFIQRSDLACAESLALMLRLPERTLIDDLRLNMPKRTGAMRKTLAVLGRTPLPAASAVSQQRLLVQLEAARAATRSIDRVASAIRAGDVERYRAASQDLTASFASLTELSQAYRAYGATLCADLFDDGEDPEKPSRKT